ncbi:potassium voltage-gated channel protein Shaw-like [Pecten maximus]|uniref:potassium voltage-gated channel protein Shaw-like n=1 Tax=Pecten maximus TaxID=6579 RepID=UPI001459182E|nr:potassium voltage-gated channel protein Shaw-like [Pecten maximus]XP_033747644.1 potassium voltage-gated channel protein Shaw-like [Pecten maximus]
MTGKVYFDVGGTRFTTTWDTLQKIPGSKLDKLYERHEKQTKSSGKVEYFFDRNPAVFGCVLDYHRTGDLHLPDNVCASQIRQELEFWDISPYDVSSCCWKILYGEDGLSKTLKILDKEIPVFSTGKKFIQKTEGLSSWIRDLMEYPSSSMLAKVYAVFYLTMVVFSVICDALIRSQDYNTPQQNVSISGSSSANHLMPSLSNIPCAGLVIEILTNIVFTVDVAVRFAVSLSKINFLKSLINIMDMLALIGFWVLVFTAIFSPFITPGSEINALMVGNILMTLRFVRLYRLAKVNRGLMLVLLALDNSKTTILLLFAIMIINSCIFGGIIYCLEDINFTNVFRAFYWAIITMTTVGYGDIYPSSVAGRVIACVCAMTGLFLIAMPIGIISKNYTYLYTRLNHREHHCEEKRKCKKSIKFNTLTNGDISSLS